MKKIVLSISLFIGSLGANDSVAGGIHFHLNDDTTELESNFFYQTGLRQGKINAKSYYGSFNCTSFKEFPVSLTIDDITNNPYLYGHYKGAIEVFESLRLENLLECADQSSTSSLSLENAIARYKEVELRINQAIAKLLHLECIKDDNNIYCTKDQLSSISDYHSIAMFFISPKFIEQLNNLTGELNSKILRRTSIENNRYMSEIRDLLSKNNFSDKDIEEIREFSKKMKTTKEVNFLNKVITEE